MRRHLTRLGLAAALLVLTPPVICWVAVRAGSYPRARLEPRASSSLTVLDAAGGILRQDATAAGGRESWVPLDRVSPDLVNATLASEDRRFWKHGGVDPVGIARALALDLGRGRAAFGGSTLTMQLARLVDPRPRTLWGKLREAVAAGRIERALCKREILEQYLNRVYYGNGAWGAEAAARFYFGKPAAALSLGEASLLACSRAGRRPTIPSATSLSRSAGEPTSSARCSRRASRRPRRATWPRERPSCSAANIPSSAPPTSSRTCWEACRPQSGQGSP